MKRFKRVLAVTVIVAMMVVVGIGISEAIISYDEAKQEELRAQSIPDLANLSLPPYTYADLGDLDEAFVTAGEQIDLSDSTGWLISPASQLAPQNKPVGATIEADEEWSEATSYGVTVEVPDVIFGTGRHSVIDVYYPTTVKTGEYGTIVVFTASDNGCIYCGFIQFRASDDLQIVHGYSKADEPSGEVWQESNRSFTIKFHTSATPEHYETHLTSDRQSGFYGRIFTNYTGYAQ